MELPAVYRESPGFARHLTKPITLDLKDVIDQVRGVTT
jgi:hypothetical protein